jgi:NAD(P)-dependent dehydrogenase (short-subunit alcohol dehydrogenase family)
VETFRGRVAVITGGASGIGFALAERAAREGMSVAIADVEAGALESAAARLKAGGATVNAHRLDVSDAANVEAFAAQVFADAGAVHLLCNNAGVLNRDRPTWEHTPQDWKWVLDVNLWGVINGIRSFVPRMLAGGEEGHIVNTASMAGLVTGRMGAAVYDASKHAVVSLSESLYRDLAIETPLVTASVLCPGTVDTNIFTAERNRPAGTGEPEGAKPEATTGNRAEWLSPAEIADQVFEAVREKRFYILAAQTEMFEWTKMGHDRMWEGRNPAVPHRLLAARDARTR